MKENKKSKSKTITLMIVVFIIVILAINIGIILNKKYSSKNVNENNENIAESQEIENKNIEKVKGALGSYAEDIGNIENLIFDDNYNNDYRFNQTYKGIEVYGGGIVVTYKDNQIISLLNYNYEIPEGFNISPLNNNDDLVSVALEYLEYENITPTECKLIIYPINLSNFTLAYLYDFNGTKIIVSDSDKTVLGTTNSINIFDISNTRITEQIQYNYQDKEDEKNEIEKYKQDDRTYWLKDNERNIEFYKIKDEIIISEKYLNENDDYYTKFTFEEDINENNDYYTAIVAMENLQKVYDFYKKEFNYNSIKGTEEYTLKVFTNTNIVEWTDYSNNAFLNYINKDDIRINFGASNCYNDNIEVVAHEYTHGYFNGIVNNLSENETKTVNEAYADIMALIIEAYYDNAPRIDGVLCEEDEITGRNMKDSQLKYSDYNDKLEYHEASMIISKVAYLMSNDESLNIDLKDLANLWFNSLYKLPRYTVKLEDVEVAILFQAKEMGYSETDIRKVADIFVIMGYPDYYEECIASEKISIREQYSLDVEKAIALVKNNFGVNWKSIPLEYEYIKTVKGWDGYLYYAINRYAQKNFMYAGGEWLEEVSEGRYYAGTYYVRDYYILNTVYIGYNPRDLKKLTEEDKIGYYMINSFIKVNEK